MSLRDILDIILAVVAVVSVTITILAYKSSRKDRQPAIKATIGNGIPVYEGGARLGERCIFLGIANAGDKPVTINQATITVNKKTVFIPSGIPGTHKLPYELKQGEKATYWIDYEKLKSDLHSSGITGTVKLNAFFRDTLDNEYVSKSFKMNLDK